MFNAFEGESSRILATACQIEVIHMALGLRTQFGWLFASSSIHFSGSETVGSATNTPSSRSGWCRMLESR